MSAEVAHPLNKRIFLVNDGIGDACSTSRPPRPSTPWPVSQDEQEIERVHQNEDFPNKPRPNRADQPERRRRYDQSRKRRHSLRTRRCGRFRSEASRRIPEQAREHAGAHERAPSRRHRFHARRIRQTRRAQQPERPSDDRCRLHAPAGRHPLAIDRQSRQEVSVQQCANERVSRQERQDPCSEEQVERPLGKPASLDGAQGHGGQEARRHREGHDPFVDHAKKQ